MECIFIVIFHFQKNAQKPERQEGEPFDEEEQDNQLKDTPKTSRSQGSYIFDVVEGELSDLKNIHNLIFKVIEDKDTCPTVMKAM